jgi:CRISPR-associated protein Csb2
VLIYCAVEGWRLDPSGPDVGRGLDDFKQEVVASGSASAVHSFQGRFAPTLEKTFSQDASALEKNRPTVARYSLGGQAPKLTAALLLGERIHLALVELSDGASVFTGCDESGSPLKGHAHAFIFSESNLALGRGRNEEITHITIYAPAGFGSSEVSALEELKEVQGSGLYVQLNLLGLGRRDDFGGFDLRRGQSLLLAKSRAWVSRTPFIPTRHPKATRAGVPKLDASGLQIGSPEHDLRRLLVLDGFPAPISVEPVAGTKLGEQEVPWHVFLRRREMGEGKPAGNGAGYGFRIEFPEPVQGPVAVGYGAHFGMGGFVAEGDENIEEIIVESKIGV